MYFPKTLQRFSPKNEQPLSLKTLCLEATVQLLTQSNSSLERNARATKVVRKYIDSNLAAILQKEILERAIGKWYGAEKLLRLMEMFEPERITKDHLDLIGNFRYAYGCYYVENRLYWSNGTIERLNLSYEECEQLYNIVLWGSLSTLESVALSTQRKALEKSRLPSILARAQLLTSVTILNGATDHIIRLLGLNCPLLQVIDVSHSSGVTNNGMRGLLLRLPRQKGSLETNKCAHTLKRLILLGTEVTRPGYEFACRTLACGYSISFLPDTIIVRPKREKLKVKNFKIDAVGHLAWQLKLGFSDAATRGMEQIVRRYIDRVPGSEEITQVMDVYEDNKSNSVFVRETASLILQCYVRVEGNNITELILPWDSFVWRLISLPELTDLGSELPSLKVLKARIQGTWDKSDVLLPCLEVAHIWTINDSTVLAFLQNSPIIKTFMFNCLNFNNAGGEAPWNLTIDDISVKNAMECNTSLKNNIEEFCLRPAPNLTSITVEYLTKNCPKLLRLGDMESWKVTPDQIKDFNKVLDETNSRCVLTVLSFPPKTTPDRLL